MKAIINGKIITEENILEEKVLIFDNKIIDIVDLDEFKKGNFNNIYNISEIIDAKNNYVSPGFIDIHIHGSGGKDVMDGHVEDIKTISETIVKYGVTGFLPTTMTMSKEKIYKSFNAIKESMDTNFKGAKVLGVHMEGPFVNEEYKGAQNREYIMKPSYDFIKEYEDIIKIITIAPEKDENLNFIKKVKNSTDIVLSIGHSNASYDEAISAIENGVTNATHTFNAMSPLHHRNPGVVGAIFNSDIYAELIADKIHLHPSIFNIVLNIKGKDKVILVTDCMRAGCMKEGMWELGGQKVSVDAKSARLEDGTLAGSILTLNKAIKNVLDETNSTIVEAVKLASLNPAMSLGIDDKKGSIKIGKDSDIVIFDNKLNIKITVVDGNVFNIN